MILDSFNLTASDCIGTGPEPRYFWQRIKNWLTMSEDPAGWNPYA